MPYLFGGAINLPDGSQVPVQGDYREIAPLGDGWVALRKGYVDVLDAQGAVTSSARAADSLAVSPDGTVVAYATPAGVITLLTSGEPPLAITDGSDSVRGATPQGIRGSAPCAEAGSGDCWVFWDTHDAAPQGYYSSSRHFSANAFGLRSIGGVASDGRVAGVASSTDSGSCSELLSPTGSVVWRTCDFTLGAFSPDGKYVLGGPAYLDGAGDASLAILDSATGDVLASYENDATTQAYIGSAVWDGGDAEDTVLATVYEKGSWSLMRMTPDGRLSSVSGGGLAGGDEVSSPLRLPTRP